NFVILGGTNLFRSRNGFATKPTGGYDGTLSSQKDEYWIGGYNKNNGYSSYPNQHPDQHSIAFNTNNANQMWSGHDGGLSYTGDVTASAVTWTNENNGYVTTQFYSAALPQDSTDTRIMGGSQDNGTPYYTVSQQSSSQSQDISAGDGGYAYFTANDIYVEQQNGHVIRWANDFNQLSYVYPSGASNQIFIHPYAIDPNDDNVMYYPDGDHIWRNTKLDQIPNTNNGNSSSGTTVGWEELNNVTAGSQYIISAVAASKVPGNILYFGGYSPNLQPVVMRLANAKEATSGATDVSLPDNSALQGAYIKDIAVNPVNANEVLVVMSNYNITGLWHTFDGGQSWQPVEGNLTGNSTDPGPSLRSAVIVPAESGTIYLVGTSTGLYSTQQLNGSNTTWGQEASGQIGHAITEDLALRVTDGNVAAGTHGRGMYIGDFGGNTNAPYIVANPLKGQAGNTVTLNANDFQFSPTATDNIVTFNKVRAKVLSASSSKLDVEVPRGVLDPQATSNSVTITVKTNNQSIFTTFQILPPDNFTIDQNYPNPFNPSTNIPFDVSVDSRIWLVIYNMAGQKVLEPIRDQQFNAGTYNQNIDLTGLASGVYIYRVIAEPQSGSGNKHIESKKMTYIK
ncbi:MAG TPA: T9SS type A sorting domain-containing protein, partial [Balneolaceae bacterium]|nr:T9SS type A sorting domain-containing protein [Balneolaceae bacterium]